MLSDDEFEYFCVDNVMSYILFSAISTKSNFVTHSVHKYKMCVREKNKITAKFIKEEFLDLV